MVNHRTQLPRRPGRSGRLRRSFRSLRVRHRGWLRVVIITATAILALTTIAAVRPSLFDGAGPSPGAAHQAVPLIRRPTSYLGLFAPSAPQSYSGISAFASSTGVSPNLVVYYSGWFEPFQTSFAVKARRHHALTVVQIDPTNISLKAIARGSYDSYLRSFGSSVRAFGSRVIISFGHEMNGNWYSWGWRHTSPHVFVRAWRHIVNVIRAAGANNAAWLWTINVIHKRHGIPPPNPWWPGDSYVTWVGIDGYYHKPSWSFAPLFGPTIKAVHALTIDPILIAETGAAPSADKPEKVANLFTGVRKYGLLGFVWFDASHIQDWRLDSPAAIAAYRRGARSYYRPAS